MENKQTAVEWLVEKIQQAKPTFKFDSLIREAKEIEKQQIIHAYGQGTADEAGEIIDATKTAEQYYNETYGK